jgi:chemotaxis protein MotC
MMRHGVNIAFGATLLLAMGFGSGAVAASAEKAAPAAPIAPLAVHEPSPLARNIRALQLVQDRLASGNAVALDAQGAIIERIMAAAEKNAAADAAIDAGDGQLLAMALMNGADPTRLPGVKGLAGEDPLLRAALAYAEGRLGTAQAAFAKLDMAALPVSLRAQARLTYGALMANFDPKVALAAFADARMLAPGTLIEEAALRREVGLRLDEPERMLVLASTYLRRFGASPFASAFISQFAFAIAAAPETLQEQVTAQLDGLLAEARGPDRQAFYTILARSTLVGGNHVLAGFASRKAMIGANDATNLLSARLYNAALAIASDAPGSAAAELHSLTRAPLRAADQEILQAAIGIARELRRWPYDTPLVLYGASPADERAGPPVLAGEPDPMTAGMQAAKAALDATGNLAEEP